MSVSAGYAGHQTSHKAGAKIFERERRPVKELQNITIQPVRTYKRDQTDFEIEGIIANRMKRFPIDLIIDPVRENL